MHLRVDDGRKMMLTPKRYDVITADITQPIFAGSGNLYSREYFELMRRVLKPGGVVMQWIPGTGGGLFIGSMKGDVRPYVASE